MKKELQEKIATGIKDFQLPSYDKLPDVGLYLEQTVKLINSYLSAFDSMQLTTSMVSNYVKKKMIDTPIKKQYYQQHISRLIFIAMMKSVLSLDDIGKLITLQKECYETSIAYDYLCDEFKNVLLFTFGLSDNVKKLGKTDTDAKDLFTTAITTVANKIYLDAYIRSFREERMKEEE